METIASLGPAPTASSPHKQLEEEARAILGKAEALRRSLVNSSSTITASKSYSSSESTPPVDAGLEEEASALRAAAQSIADRSLDNNDASSGNSNSGGGRLHGALLAVLGDVHAAAREIEERMHEVRLGMVRADGEDGTQCKEWQAPSMFERRTSKYWVPENKLDRVLLASVAQAPVLVYGRRGGRIPESLVSNEDESGGDDIWSSSLASRVTSVYLDSDDMDMYSVRLARAEGAMLLRLRWYGNCKPRHDEKIFVELKTHHERWVGAKSVKERVAIKEGDVQTLLDLDGGSWDEQFASSIIRKANPSADAESISASTELLLRMRRLILERRLAPCVRTSYWRVAFQSADHNRFRLTLDRDVVVMDERRRAPSSQLWCLNDEEVTNLLEDAVARLPFCVYEVKTVKSEAEAPPFVVELEEGRHIFDAHKFSKFLTGASIFNASVALPWWAAEAPFACLYQARDRQCIEGAAAAAVAAEPQEVSGNDQHSISDTLGTKSRSVSVKAYEGAASHGVRVRRRSTAKYLLRRISMTDKTDEPSIYPWDRETPRTGKSVASKVRVRVEPKSHFANERTFIQWVSAALLLITFSQLLWIMADGNEALQGASVAGTWMLAMSLFVVVYALATYYRRIHLMLSGKPYGYVDRLGPAVLTACIVVGVILLITYAHRARDAPPDAAEAQGIMIHQEGQCVRRSMSSVPDGSRISLLMELQPSGALVDESRNMLLVPSLNTIVALRDGLPADGENEENVQVVARINGADIEALEQVGDQVFALSEAGKDAKVIALEWSSDEEGTSSELREMHRWVLPKSNSDLPASEGLALLPDETTPNRGEVVIAHTSVDVFDLTSFTRWASSVEKKTVLNWRMLARGLKDAKVGDLQYFKGLLWVLFDNARVIRGVNTTTSKIVHEIDLPVAEVGSESQWEGMRFQRVNGVADSQRGLRGSSARELESSMLVLHLALDSPAMIWSIRVEEMGGILMLPQCATAA